MLTSFENIGHQIVEQPLGKIESDGLFARHHRRGIRLYGACSGLQECTRLRRAQKCALVHASMYADA